MSKPKLSVDDFDLMLNEATHAVASEAEEFGIELFANDLYAINDFLTVLLGEKCELE